MSQVCIGFLIMICTAGSHQAPPVRADFCDPRIYQPVLWSSADTRKTKEQIDRNNRRWKALCRGKL